LVKVEAQFTDLTPYELGIVRTIKIFRVSGARVVRILIYLIRSIN